MKFANVLTTPALKKNTSRGAIELYLKHFCILMNVDGLLKFSTLGNIFQGGTLQKMMNNGSSLYKTQLAVK